MRDFERSTPDEAVHRFAWDGFSFPMPNDWNMADYRLDPKKGSTARFDDDASARLEVEWIRASKPAIREAFLRHYTGMASELEKQKTRIEPLDGLPPQWSGKMYVMPDKRLLATAFGVLQNTAGLQMILRVHFHAASLREPPRLLRGIIAGFQVHARGRIPWEVFDAAFELGAEWRLGGTSFKAGLKHFLFVRSARRLGIWFCSLADIALRGKSPEAWASDFLGTVKRLEGRRFVPETGGRIRAARRMKYPFGHAEEIARWCFKYQARCIHDPLHNRLVLAVLQHRSERDSGWADFVVPGLNTQGQSFFG